MNKQFDKMNTDSRSNEFNEMIKNLKETFERQRLEGKERNYKVIMEAVDAIMLRQLDEIIDNQHSALERCQRNIRRHQMNYENKINKSKKLGGNGEIL